MNFEAVLDLLRAVILMIVLLGTVRLFGKEKYKASVVFFALAVACIMFVDLYWLVYEVMRPDVRLPFAANEFGEWAMFLLFGESLTCGHPICFRKAKLELLGTILFVAANVALWIGWSGEWAQDILTGLVFAYFLCALVYRIKEGAVFSGLQWNLLGIACLVLIAAQTATFFLPEKFFKPLDLSCYALMFATAAVLLVKAVLSLKKGDAPNKSICHTFSAFAWVIVTMYMSAEVFHAVAFALSAVCFVLMYLAMRKEFLSPDDASQIGGLSV